MGTRLMAVAVAVITAGTLVWGATRVPARDRFRDATGDRIQSDHDVTFGNIFYEDGVACVVSWVQSNYLFLRTVTHTCPVSTGNRKITLDFSDAVTRTPDTADPCLVDDAYGQAGTLDICRSNVVADVRVIATSLFAKNAVTNGTPLTLPFSLSPDFSNTAFSLEFEQNVRVFADPTNRNAREMEAASSAVAELYKYGVGTGGKVSLGRYHMPFRLRVEKLP